MRLQWLLLSRPAAVYATVTAGATACTATAAGAASASRPTSYASRVATCTYSPTSSHARCLQ